MVEYDVLTGEDVRKVQRQQYENWFKQQKVWQQERAMRDQMEALDGKRRQGAAGGQTTTDYQSLLNSGLKSDTLTNQELEVSHRFSSSADAPACAPCSADAPHGLMPCGQNVIFATGAKGFDNTEILRKKDWGPVRTPSSRRATWRGHGTRRSS